MNYLNPLTKSTHWLTPDFTLSSQSCFIGETVQAWDCLIDLEEDHQFNSSDKMSSFTFIS